jgi:oxygen-independent coproporphyrinogen-3 oxidase
MNAVLQALADEMALQQSYIEPPDTLYIGGGTPSLYRAEELGGLVAEAKKVWRSNFKEVTVELNPEDVTLRYCQTLAGYGVNRLSIGIQSFFDEHLSFMNRRHNAVTGVNAVKYARLAGFQNISIDLIFGFPLLTSKQWRQNIRYAMMLAPEHLSAYQLGIEPNTPFYRMVQEGTLQPVSQEVAAEQYALLQMLLSKGGWKQYEVSNFSREGYRSLHNSAYWQGVFYLGLGPSAHSFNGKWRHANVKSIPKYIMGVQAKTFAQKEERITPKKRYNEFVMTRLRTIEGFSREVLWQQIPNPHIRHHFEKGAKRLLQLGLLSENEGYIKILPEKWFVSDGIISELMI